MNPYELLQDQISASSLSKDQQEEFLWFLTGMPVNFMMDILEMSKEDPKFIDTLWHNYNQKEKAFMANDTPLANEIVAQEKAYLDTLE